MKLSLFFTYGTSAKDWHNSGLLHREIVLYQRLIKEYGVKVQFITYGDDSDHEFIDSSSGIELVPIYSYMKMPKNKYIKLMQTILIPWRLKKEIKSSNILKTNQMLGSWVAVIAKIMFKKSLILRGGYEIYLNTLRTKKNLLHKFFIYSISLLSYKISERIHVATNDDKKFVVKNFNINPEKVFIYPNWIDVDKFKKNETIKKNNKLLFVGRLNSQKNIDLLIKALVGTDITLDIVGSGELKGELIRLAKTLKVNVNFLGNISNSKMPEIYNQYRIYVLCSNYEGNPKTLLEAMACGCSVIGTAVPGIKQVILNNQTGLLVEEDVESLKSTIKLLLADKALQKELSKNASLYIKENNSLDNAITYEMTAYNKTIA
jgi:glycosyltransferase involved in cell wall biosynthesis